MPQFLPFAAAGENGDPNFPDNAGGGGAIIEIQEFEVTGMWTAPMDCVAALIQGAGGGGSGGAGNSISGPGGTTFGRATGGTGGGAGEYREDIVNITGGATYAVTVGTGAPQTASSVAGSAGNTSTVVGTGVNISFAPGAGGNIGHTISGGLNTEQGEINTGLNTTFPIGAANFRGGLGGASPKGDGERAIGMFASTTSARESQFAIDSSAPIGDTTFLIRSASSGRYRFGPGSRGGYNEKAIGGLGDEGRFDTGGVISVAGGAAGGGGGWVDGSVGTASNPNPVNNGSTATFGGAGGRGGVRIFAYSIVPTITT